METAEVSLPTLDRIWEWYLDSCEFEDARRETILNSLDLPRPGSLSHTKWFAMDDAEVRRHFFHYRQQLDLAASTSMLIHGERLLRVDSLERAKRGKRRHPINKQFRALYKKAGNSFVGLKGDILAIWTQNNQPDVFGSMSALFQYRDWLAHGQFSDSRPGRTFDSPELIFLEVQKLESELDRLRLKQPP